MMTDRDVIRALDSEAKVSLRRLADAENRRQELLGTQKLIDAARVLMEAGQKPQFVSQIVDAAAVRFMDAVMHQDAGEPNVGGHPGDLWWRAEDRAQDLLLLAKRNPHLKPGEVVYAWSNSEVAKTMPRSTTAGAIRKRLRRLLQKEKDLDALFEEFPDEG